MLWANKALHLIILYRELYPSGTALFVPEHKSDLIRLPFALDLYQLSYKKKVFWRFF